MQLLVIKRNLNVEVFLKGRVALAVFKAMRANAEPADKCREVGGKVANKIETLILSKEVAAGDVAKKVDIEWIQDEVVKEIERLGYKAIAKKYQSYREQRSVLRKDKQSKKDEIFYVKRNTVYKKDLLNKIIKIGKSFGLELAELHLNHLFNKERYESWAELLESMIDLVFELGQAGQLSTQESQVQTTDSFLCWIYYQWSLCLKIDFNWLDCLDENSSKEVCFLKSEFELIIKEYLKKSVLVNNKEINVVKTVDDILAKLALKDLVQGWRISFPGQKLIKETFGDLSTVVFFKMAFILKEKADALKLFKCLNSGDMVFPLLLMKSIINDSKVRGFERALVFEDKTEDIFSGLLKVATLIKDGNSVSIDISKLRGKGVAVGKEGNVSAGIEPIMNMIAQTGEMLSGVNGDKQKARIFLEVWHWDLERFLGFAKKEAESNIIRTAIFVSDVFMRQVIDGKEWILGTPEELSSFFSAKTISERQRVILELIDSVKRGEHSGAFLKIVPARTVFEWICSAIASGAGTSIVFKDTCKTFDLGLKGVIPSTRLGALLLPNEKDQIAEVALRFTKDVEKNVQLLDLAEKTLICEDKDIKNYGLGICIVGNVEIDCVSDSIGKYFDLHGQVWSSGGFWGLSNPWESFKKGLYQSRGGYLESIGTTIKWGSKNGPNFGRFFLQTPREEYLLLSSESPRWFGGGDGKKEYKWKNKKIILKNSKIASIQEQALRASEWQSVTDQTVTWDVFLNEIEEHSIGESIKTGWIYGLHVVRRFVKING